MSPNVKTSFRLPAPLRLLALSVAVSAALNAPLAMAQAEDYAEVNRLLRAGQMSEALSKADAFLAGKPRDPQMRFLKGVIQTEAGKPADAIATFNKLTEDYPELPEPYNNLAVLYAQQKQYDKAKQALEMAIRTHPSYATAHENLGDIYARLASQAYDKALQIDSSNSSAQNKLALIRDLMSTASRPGKVTKPVAEVRPAEPVKLAEAPKSAPAAATPVPAAVPAKPAEAPKPAPTKAAGDANAEITRAIDLWAAAWSRKDVKAYLAAYASDFKTPAGESRSAWDAERQKRIAKPGAINVSYESLRIAVDGETATVKFRQHYKSASLKTSSNKVLLMGKRDGKWQILQERVGS